MCAAIAFVTPSLSLTPLLTNFNTSSTRSIVSSPSPSPSPSSPPCLRRRPVHTSRRPPSVVRRVTMASDVGSAADSIEKQPLSSSSSSSATTTTENEDESANTTDIVYSGPFGWLRKLISRRNELKASTLRNYGIAALISYGMFDFVTYSISFLLSLKAYIATGGQLTWKTLPQVLVLMWGFNNLSRPFRIAGAIALAPIVDRRVVKPLGRFFSRLRQNNSNDNADGDTTTDT